MAPHGVPLAQTALGYQACTMSRPEDRTPVEGPMRGPIARGFRALVLLVQVSRTPA